MSFGLHLYRRIRILCANPTCGNFFFTTEEHRRRVKHPACSTACRQIASRTPKGPDNPLFKGRRVTSDGVVLIYVGVGHPLANRQGYACEHRVVAQQMIGRPLLPSERVVHLDNDPGNNAPSNLRVVSRGEAQRLAARTRSVQRG